jgi:hypothetical protein
MEKNLTKLSNRVKKLDKLTKTADITKQVKTFKTFDEFDKWLREFSKQEGNLKKDIQKYLDRLNKVEDKDKTEKQKEKFSDLTDTIRTILRRTKRVRDKIVDKGRELKRKEKEDDKPPLLEDDEPLESEKPKIPKSKPPSIPKSKPPPFPKKKKPSIPKSKPPKFKIKEGADVEALKKKVAELQEKLETKKKKRMSKKARERLRLDQLPPRQKGSPFDITKKKLQRHQVAFVENFLKSPTRGAMAIHGVGSGKTLTAVITAEMYLKANPTHKVIVITPASLLGNFKNELYEYDPAIEADDRYEFFTYDGYARAYKIGLEKAECKDALMIVDEGQNLRTKIKIQKELDVRASKDEGVPVIKESVKSGARVLNILKGCGMTADKILILSATPLVNSPEDIENLMAIINGHEPLDPKSFPFEQLWRNPKLSAKYFGCRLSFFNQPQEVLDKFYPNVDEMFVPIVMNEKTQKAYDAVEKMNIKDKKMKAQFGIKEGDNQEKLKSFYNGLRRASNSLGGANSQKVDFIIDWIKGVIDKKPNAKLGLTKRMIDTHTDKSVIFTHFLGAGSDLIIQRLRENNIPYGSINGKVSKSRRTEIVRDYVDGKIKVILISKAGAEGLNLLETGYMFLVEPSWNNTEVEQVKGRGVRFKSHLELPKKLQNVLILSLFLIRKDERPLFNDLIEAQENKPEGYAGLIAPELGEKLKDPLTIDLFLYNKSNMKQKYLDEALKEMKKIERLEKCRSDKDFLDIAGIFEMKRSGKTIPKLSAWERAFYRDEDPEGEYEKPQGDHKTTEEGELTLRQLTEKMKGITRKIFGGNKALVQSQNAFFTPPSVAKDMVKFSGITTSTTDIVFLEPTAGAGFIAYEALLESKKKKNVYADVLENLQPLAKFLDEFPRTRVMPQRNYFDLPKDKKYRVILMNPPFNVAKGKALKSRSAKDVDFVLDAWKNHLAEEGVLVCLISNAYEFRGENPRQKADRRIYQPFRDLLNEHDHQVIEYETGFSKGTSKSELKEMATGVRMRMIKILKKKE